MVDASIFFHLFTKLPLFTKIPGFSKENRRGKIKYRSDFESQIFEQNLHDSFANIVPVYVSAKTMEIEEFGILYRRMYL